MTDYLAWNALRQQYWQAASAGRPVKALADAIAELERRMGWR